MPYATRKMLSSMKSGSGGSSNSTSKHKKVREIPSSMASGSSATSGGSSGSGSSGGASSSHPTTSGTRTSSFTGTVSGASSSHKGSSSKTSAGGSSSRKSSSSTSMGSKSKTSHGSKSSGHSKSSSSRSGSSAASGSTSGVSSSAASASAQYSSSVKPVSVSGFDHEKMNIDQRKAQFIQQQLNTNVERLQKLAATDPERDFSQFTVDEQKKVGGKPNPPCVALVAASSNDFPPGTILAKLYPNDQFGQDSLYLKVLRHLGKKHPCVIHTFGVFSHESNFYVVQDLAPHGNMADHVGKKGPLTEHQAKSVARQMLRALDFLGDMGVCHRTISPRHLLIYHADMVVRLTGFRSTVVYFDSVASAINFQPCLPLSSSGPEAEYQALEVFGDPDQEVFDPVTADVWSYGAVVYFVLTSSYPYQSRDNPQVEDEIQNNVRALGAEPAAQNLLGHCLTTNSTERFSVEMLLNHPWLAEVVGGSKTSSSAALSSAASGAHGSASMASGSASRMASGSKASGASRSGSAASLHSGSAHSGAGSVHSGAGSVHSGAGSVHSGAGSIHSGAGSVHSGAASAHSGLSHASGAGKSGSKAMSMKSGSKAALSATKSGSRASLSAKSGSKASGSKASKSASKASGASVH